MGKPQRTLGVADDLGKQFAKGAGRSDDALKHVDEYAAPKHVRAANPSKGPLWTSASTKSGVENALSHFKKHGAEFPEYATATQFARGARDFVTNPPAGTLSKVRANGDKLFYNPTTNTLAVQRGDGALRTMFRPTDGMNYWNKQ